MPLHFLLYFNFNFQCTGNNSYVFLRQPFSTFAWMVVYSSIYYKQYCTTFKILCENVSAIEWFAVGFYFNLRSNCLPIFLNKIFRMPARSVIELCSIHFKHINHATYNIISQICIFTDSSNDWHNCKMADHMFAKNPSFEINEPRTRCIPDPEDDNLCKLTFYRIDYCNNL